MRAFTVTVTGGFVAFLNPGASTLTMYVPSSTLGNEYSPSLPVTVVRTTPRSTLRMLTVALGTTLPDESVIVPKIVPCVACPNSPSAGNNINAKTAHPRKRRTNSNINSLPVSRGYTQILTSSSQNRSVWAEAVFWDRYAGFGSAADRN